MDAARRKRLGLALAFMAAGSLCAEAAPKKLPKQAKRAPIHTAAKRVKLPHLAPLPHLRPSEAGPGGSAIARARSQPTIEMPRRRPAEAGPAVTTVARAKTAPAVEMPRKRPDEAGSRVSTAAPANPDFNLALPPRRPSEADNRLSAYAPTSADLNAALFSNHVTMKLPPGPVGGPMGIAPSKATPPADIALVKQVIAAARKGDEAVADVAEKTIGDPVARKLAEWVLLRSDNTTPSFQRYAKFVHDNPSWPHIPLFRKRAENALWNDKLDKSSVLAYFTQNKPSTAKGRYALARALLAKGDRQGAAALVRYAWRNEDCSADVEEKVLDMFGPLITREDHKARMEQRFYESDTEAGMREGHRLGGGELALARARTGVIKDLKNAKALLDAVPASLHHDPGYIFARAQWLRRHDKPEEASKLILSAPHDSNLLLDTNRWWLELRVLVRKLLDKHDVRTAYLVARDAAPPTQDNWRVDKHFTAGWIALRFLHDAKTAAAHFAHIRDGTDNPHALARAGYWQGRAAEAMGEQDKAKAFYERAAKFTVTYYGQLARARLGLTDLGLRGPTSFTPEERKVLGNLEVVRAAEILYTLDERDMLASMFAEIGVSGTDVAGMSALADVAKQHGDGRAMVLLGRYAHARGLPLDYYAYPTVGLPNYKPIAPPIEQALAYSIARQESSFNQQDVSPAHAMGLMQVTPEAARDTAGRFKVKYDRARLLKDPVYNMQMGAGELSNLMHVYRGSYLLTFVGYNAGPGRAQQWIKAYGDPRDPKVDPVDWAERIPIAETRNYVQRVMENMQVYRARFGGGSKLVIEADLRRGGRAN